MTKFAPAVRKPPFSQEYDDRLDVLARRLERLERENDELREREASRDSMVNASLFMHGRGLPGRGQAVLVDDALLDLPAIAARANANGIGFEQYRAAKAAGFEVETLRLDGLSDAERRRLDNVLIAAGLPRAGELEKPSYRDPKTLIAMYERGDPRWHGRVNEISTAAGFPRLGGPAEMEKP
jgi:hypothetical protein